MKHTVCCLAAGSLLLTGATASACGPDFPASYLSGSKFGIAAALGTELELIATHFKLAGDDRFRASHLSTEAADLRDVRLRYNRQDLVGTDPGDREAWVARYADAEAAIRGGAEATVPEPPPQLKEFTLYLEGVAALTRRPPDDCSLPRAWYRLLALPADARRFRTTWVLYMAGNLSGRAGDDAAAATAYSQLRQAVREGFVDTLGLAHASWRRQYQSTTDIVAKVRAGAAAVGYYRNHGDKATATWIARDVGYVASRSMRWLTPDDELRRLISDPVGREVVAAVLLADRYSEASAGNALELIGTADVREGERLAALAYERGDYELCRRWLAHTPDSSMVKFWLLGALCRRDGDYAAAARHLRHWLAAYQQERSETPPRFSFAYPYYWDDENADIDAEAPPVARDVRGLLGSVVVCQGDFLEAVECFILAGSWCDAGWTADTLVPLDDLKGYVDATCPPADIPSSPSVLYHERLFPWESRSQAVLRQQMRWLLARRLTRNGRLHDALPYYPPPIRDHALRLAVHLRGCDNPRLPRDQRALHAYNAGKLMRWQGMELRGTEFAPDYTVVDGSFDYAGVDEDWFAKDPRLARLAETVAASRPTPNLRFHYRFVAAELMSRAAELAETPELAAMSLYLGGRWLTGRDPEAAERYYKRLVRLTDQPLAKAAAARHWLPNNLGTAISNELENVAPVSLNQVVALAHAVEVDLQPR